MHRTETSALVSLEIDGDVATITLRSPHNRNALSRQLLVELHDALERCELDPTVRVVVLTAEGPAFCAGADLKEQQDGLGAGPVTFPDVLERILTSRLPFVVRVNGAARAGGLGLMAACDIVVATNDCTFAFSEVRIGVVPAVISLPVLLRMNASIAHELFLTGGVFDAARAHDAGLVNAVATPDSLDAVVALYVSQLLLGGPRALAATKALRHRLSEIDLPSAFAALLELSARHFASEEGQAAITARKVNRPAPWIPSQHEAS